MTRGRRESAQRLAGWLAAPLLLAAMIAINGVTGPTYLMGDFRAFYCAGAAIAQGADPYRQEPLHECERNAGPPRQPATLRAIALPAPLPPHALLLFAPLSRLPFALAAAVYGLLLISAMSTSVALFARITGAGSGTLNIAFAAITATVTYYVGQPLPFVFLALAGAALLARSGRWNAAAACAAAATIEPHVALPVIAAMLAALPRTRLPLALCGAAFALAGIAAVGVPASIEYVRDVVPAHALANAFEWQFSLTSILTSLHVPAAAAIRAGEIMFAATTALGVMAAVRLRRMTGDDALIVLVPPAFAVFGGVHVHFQQIAVAFPAILYVVVRHAQVRALAVSGLVLAMIPWNVMSASLLAGASPLFAGAVAARTLGRKAGLVFALVAAAIGLSVLALASAGLGPPEVAFTPHAYPPDALAEASWGEFSRAALMRASVMMQWLRVPTLAGLACGLIAIARIAFAPQPASDVRAFRVQPAAATS
ncbi:MAG: glycosyltransferase 87 family protein [Candidatus Velthaea sp.]